MPYHHRTVAWLNLKDAIKSHFKRLLIGLPILAILGLTAFHVLRPRHEGKTPAEWIRELARAPADSEAAIQAMGEAAVPAISRMLAARDSGVKDWLRKLTQGLPGSMRLFPVPAEEERLLAALACCAYHQAPESILPTIVGRLADNEEIEGIESFASRRHGYSARNAPRVKTSPTDWIRTGPGVMSTNRNLTPYLSSYRPRDFLAVFCADTAAASLPALLSAAGSETGAERRRLMITVAQTLRVMGAMPQTSGERWNDGRVIIDPSWFGNTEQQQSLGRQLFSFADDEDEIVRACSIYALGVLFGSGIQIPEARETLMTAAKDGANIVRIRFAQAVANMPFETDGFLRLATRLTLDPASEVRNAAITALQFHLLQSRIRFEDLGPLLSHESHVIRFEAVRAIGQCPEGQEVAIPALLEQMQQAPEEYWLAVRSGFQRLSENHKKECAAALTKAIRDRSPQVRVLAAHSLATIDGDTRSTQIFIVHAMEKAEILQHGNPQIVRHALAAMGDLGARAAAEGVPALTRYIHNRTAPTHLGFAVIALARLGKDRPDKILPAIAELLNDPDPNTVAGAIRACQIIGPRHAAPLSPKLRKLRSDKRRYDAQAISWGSGRKPLRELAAKTALDDASAK